MQMDFFKENNNFFKQTADGTDDGIGVLSKLNGPVVIRFVSDDQPGFTVRYVTRQLRMRAEICARENKPLFCIFF
jgi:hypothetical protein